MKYRLKEWMPALVMVLFLLIALILFLNILAAVKISEETNRAPPPENQSRIRLPKPEPAHQLHQPVKKIEPQKKQDSTGDALR